MGAGGALVLTLVDTAARTTLVAPAMGATSRTVATKTLFRVVFMAEFTDYACARLDLEPGLRSEVA